MAQPIAHREGHDKHPMVVALDQVTSTTLPSQRVVPEAPGEHSGGGHSDPVTPILIDLVAMLLAARIGGHLAELVNQPPVLGELIAGVAIGAVALAFPEDSALGQLVAIARQDGSHIDILARLGVVLLLFEVGLEATVDDMLRVGVPALLVAIVGVVTPMLAGIGFGMLFIKELPEGANPFHVYLFLGATLSATSVGITARVFNDLKRITMREARIVLGAAVIDDVLGLIVLAAVSGLIMATHAQDGAHTSVIGLLTWTTFKAVVFLVLAVVVGGKAAPILFTWIAGLRGKRLVLTAAITFCFFLSWMAAEVGLAPIVGAFAAGLIITDRNLRPFRLDGEFSRPSTALHHKVGALAAFLVPVFFVQMGIRVDLTTFLDLQVLLIAGLLTVAAIVGKLVCGAVVRGNLWQRATVGVGMIPRGEVGLIFAQAGLSLGVVTHGTFSSILIMVVLTTFVTPLILKICLSHVPPSAEELQAVEPANNH